METYGADAVRAQLDYAPYRKPGTNPAGALVRSIEDGWAPPEGWAKAQEREAAAARQAAEDDRQRAEEEARRRVWEALSPEERVQGRLEFWIAGQRRRLGREPTSQEIADQQRVLVAQLAPAETGQAQKREKQDKIRERGMRPIRPLPGALRDSGGGTRGPVALSEAIPEALRDLVPGADGRHAGDLEEGDAAPAGAYGAIAETRRAAAR